MPIRFLIFLFASLFLQSAPLIAQAEASQNEVFKDPCDWLEVGLRLKKSWREGDSFIGEFEIKPWPFEHGSRCSTLSI